MPALNNEYMADILYTLEKLHNTNIVTLTPITFTTPPPGLMLTEYTQKAIAKFDIVLNRYLNKYYQSI